METDMVFEMFPRGDIEDINPITGEVSIYNYAHNKYVPPPKDPNIPPPVPIELDPEDLPGYWKPEDRHRYLSQLKESEGFDVESPPVGVCGAISPINHHMEVCVRMARLAVDEFNRRHKGSDLQFIQVIKVMGKAANGIQYYITGEAKFPISKWPSTFQAVTQTGVKGTEVRSFRFVSDSQKDPWVWVGHLCCKYNVSWFALNNYCFDRNWLLVSIAFCNFVLSRFLILCYLFVLTSEIVVK